MNTIDQITNKDPELNGNVSRALLSGHDFAYWLAQLGPWADERPSLKSNTGDKEDINPSLPSNFYRQSGLEATPKDFFALSVQSQLLQQPELNGFRLWQSMHPEPLSLFNDPLRLDDEVIENCESHVRRRLKSELNIGITPDPTLLESIIPEEREWLA